MDMRRCHGDQPYDSGWEAKDGIVYIAFDYSNISHSIEILLRVRALPGISDADRRDIDAHLRNFQIKLRACVLSSLEVPRISLN